MVCKEKLISALAERIGCKKCEAEKFLDTFKDLMKEYLLSGETVKMVGFFKAEVKEYKGRMGRNPQTGEPVEILPYKKIKFTVSEGWNKEVNETKRGKYE